MIEFEKKYWSENEFSRSNGENYTGYVGIYKRKGYIYDTQEPLISNSTYYTQFNTSGMFFDRILDSELKMPYTKKEIQFSPNDFLYKGTIKNILKKLQANNDYLYKCSTISDTLIPAVDDCSILATTDNSYYVFVGKSGKTYKEIPKTLIDSQNDILNDVIGGYITNPSWDKNEEKSYVLQSGSKPKASYSNKMKYIPNVRYIIDIKNGELSRYDFSSYKKTKSVLDPTFYPQRLENGDVTTPLYNFNEIVSSEAIITDVGMQEILVSDSEVLDINDVYDTSGYQKRKVKRVRILLFLVFKDKVVIMRYVYYPDDFYVNKKLGSVIDFSQSSNDILVMNTVDSSNKNSLNFLSLKDCRIHGNYLYLVDEKLHMVMRYNIEHIKNWQGVNSWDVKNIKLIDLLQGEGSVRDDIYFKSPCSICADDNNIYVADSGNGCIKKYSSSFTFERLIRNGQFTSQDIQSISINPYSFDLEDGTHLNPNSLWIFSTTTNYLYISIIDNDKMVYSRRINKIQLLDDKYMWNEEFKSVKFSFSNSNYFYICTTKRVYKIHLSNPIYPFASLSYFKQRLYMTTMVWSRVPYPWHLLPCGEDEEGIDVTWSYRPSTSSAEILNNKAFCLCGCDGYKIIDDDGNRQQFNGDIIFHIGTMYNQSKIDTFCKNNNCTFQDIPQVELTKMINCSGMFIYNETTSFLSCMTKLDFPAYISDEINEIDSSEYINPQTFNKIIYKIAYNLVNLKNHLVGRFWGSYNLDGIMCYDQLEYDDYFQQLRIEKTDDLFVHENEPMSIMVNRIFEKIYDIQEKILIRMEAKYRAMGAFTNNSFRII